jgi:[ribosomal protein S18]-alanine N-acetyltransferase
MIEIVKLKPALSAPLAKFFAGIDVPAIQAVFHPHPFTKEQAEKLCRGQGKDLYFAATHEGRVVGYSMLRGWDEGFEIPSLGICVDPAFQGLGLGAALMQHLISAALVAGSKKIILKVNRTNEPAIQLYRKFGFELADHDPEYLRGTLALRRS